MFRYEYDKSRASPLCEVSRARPMPDRARRPLPPRPTHVEIARNASVPLRVWIVAGASCLSVCAVLVLATVVVMKWGATDLYGDGEHIIYSQGREQEIENSNEDLVDSNESFANNIDSPILQKLSAFRNIVTNREKTRKFEMDKALSERTQIHPSHDTTVKHTDRRIEKKDRPKAPTEKNQAANLLDINLRLDNVPKFKPILPNINRLDIKPPGHIRISEKDVNYFEDYYDDDNLYKDYMESNSVTSYLLEKIQELYDWINKNVDAYDGAKRKNGNNTFGQVLKALNESLIEGNATIVMSKLRDLYFGDNYTTQSSKKVIVNNNNTADLLSFGILSMDIMLLHNIQLMAWENQESVRRSMLNDPDVFAFNALFLEPGKIHVETKKIDGHLQVQHNNQIIERYNNAQDPNSELDVKRNFLENMIELGMSTARAAIHLGRAYKNTKNVLNRLQNKEAPSKTHQLSRDVDGNSHALTHLQSSYESGYSDMSKIVPYTELDCVWILYCRNLAATAKLNAPYGFMARINGMALRMLTGDLSANKALDTLLYEALSGWTELRCNDMFPRCSVVNASSIVLESITQPLKKRVTEKKQNVGI